MTQPTERARAVLRELVAHMDAVDVLPQDPWTFTGYKVIHDALGLERMAETYGDSLKVQGLAELAEWTKEFEHPAITGLIVDQTQNSDQYLRPGQGYFELFGKKHDDYVWWRREIERSLSYDWRPFLTDPMPPKSASAAKTEKRIHICVGDPKTHLRKDGTLNLSQFGWWNLRSDATADDAAPGETVVFYLHKPRSEFVAVATSNSGIVPCPDRDDKYRDDPCILICDVRALPRRVSVSEVKKAFPTWTQDRFPEHGTLVPQEHIERFLELLQAPAPATHSASDLSEPPPRVPTTTYRILRDTEMARNVKRLHSFRCQICGETIALPDGSFYAEA